MIIVTISMATVMGIYNIYTILCSKQPLRIHSWNPHTNPKKQVLDPLYQTGETEAHKG